MPSGIEVIHIGMGTVHDDAFVYSRPRGTGVWVFLHLPIPLEIDTVHGREISQPGDCILHDPHFSQMHRALPGGFNNDWMHFGGDWVPGLVAECGIPVNQLVRPGSSDFVRVALNELLREFEERGLHWQRRMESLTADLMWHMARRLFSHMPVTASRAEREHQVRLRAVRREMLDELDRVWTVAELAKRVNLSEPRFSALYRRLFNTSPNDELIRARIDHAKYLLAHTSLPIKCVAEQCGFESLAYFSRTFRRQVGCAPRDYMRLPLSAGSPHV